MFGIARDWKQYECPSTGDWFNTPWNVYAVENYPDVEMTEEPCYAPVCNTLQNILLSWGEKHKVKQNKGPKDTSSTAICVTKSRGVM